MLPFTILIFAALRNILAGLATPTELAAMGAFGGIVLTFIYGKLNWQMFKETSIGPL